MKIGSITITKNHGLITLLVILVIVIAVSIGCCQREANVTTSTVVTKVTDPCTATTTTEPNFILTTPPPLPEPKHLSINLTPAASGIGPATASCLFPDWYIPEGIKVLGHPDNEYDLLVYIKGKGTTERIAVRLWASSEWKFVLERAEEFYITNRGALVNVENMVVEVGEKSYSLQLSLVRFDASLPLP